MFNINGGFLDIADAPCFFFVFLYTALTNQRLISSRCIWSSCYIFHILTKGILFDEFGPYLLRWFIFQWKFSMYHKLILFGTCFSHCYNIIHDIIICFSLFWNFKIVSKWNMAKWGPQTFMVFKCAGLFHLRKMYVQYFF